MNFGTWPLPRAEVHSKKRLTKIQRVQDLDIQNMFFSFINFFIENFTQKDTLARFLIQLESVS